MIKKKPALKLSLCPRCELNYITPSEKYCKICLQDMQSTGNQEEVELCSICNENPVMPGRDVCSICFQEMSGEEVNTDNPDDECSVPSVNLSSMESVSEMDEILPEIEDNMTDSPELEKMDGKEEGDIENPVSLEMQQEMEDAFDDEDDEEEM